MVAMTTVPTVAMIELLHKKQVIRLEESKLTITLNKVKI